MSLLLNDKAIWVEDEPLLGFVTAPVDCPPSVHNPPLHRATGTYFIAGGLGSFMATELNSG